MNIDDIQKFRIEKINRSALKNAPYNPRKIKKTNRKALKEAISRHGLLEPLVWNRTTGNIVSGHQRIKILDDLVENKDYDLNVAVVELSEHEEAQTNIIMNNPALQGQFDFPKLELMIEEFSLDFSDICFDIKTNFELEYTEPDPDPDPEPEPEKYIISLILTQNEKDRWHIYKKKHGFKKDRDAFLKLMENT